MFRATTLLCIVGFLGCANGNDDGKADPDTGTRGTGRISFNAFCGLAGRAHCELAKACSCSTDAEYADCISGVEEHCKGGGWSDSVRSAVEEGALAYDEEDAWTYVETIRTLAPGCEVTRFPTFRTYLRPAVEVGGACTGILIGSTLTNTCARGDCNDATRTCQDTEVRFRGESCTRDQSCAEFTHEGGTAILACARTSSTATSGICSDQVPNGQPCSTPFDCANGRCSEGVCVQKSGADGPCQSHFDCVDLRCDATTRTCLGLAEVDAACENNGQCRSGYCEDGTCAVGAAAPGTLVDDCQACQSNTCRDGKCLHATCGA